ncbi:helix-turn-helix domain-containing protein [Aneurinibacillus thermoaerophilus]|uniref:helix-turn-helix domain-containing protein n=1 Tax=Aneurinibacillus thermoaerophilus TaxID=143495 RepID=UPI00399C845D
MTEELEAKILAMAAEGTSRRKIAKMLGISISTVNRVVKGKGVSEDLLEHFEQEDRLFFIFRKGMISRNRWGS